MNIKQYIVYRNDKTNHPMLKEKRKIQWGSNILEYEDIVEFLNTIFFMNHLEEEYVYVISYNCQMIPQGIFELSHGTADTSLIGMRELGIFLLLSGANKFIVVHNHPNGNTEISSGDFEVTNKIRELANLLGVEFRQHLIIGNDGWNNIIEDYEDIKDFKEDINNQKKIEQKTVFGFLIE